MFEGSEGGGARKAAQTRFPAWLCYEVVARVKRKIAGDTVLPGQIQAATCSLYEFAAALMGSGHALLKFGVSNPLPAAPAALESPAPAC